MASAYSLRVAPAVASISAARTGKSSVPCASVACLMET